MSFAEIDQQLLLPGARADAYATGFWNTDQIVTIGLFHFIGPTNGYTRTLHSHSASISLG